MPATSERSQRAVIKTYLSWYKEMNIHIEKELSMHISISCNFLSCPPSLVLILTGRVNRFSMPPAYSVKYLKKKESDNRVENIYARSELQHVYSCKGITLFINIY